MYKRQGETERELYPARVLLTFVLGEDWQDRYPGATVGFCEKRRPLVLREVDKHVRGLAADDVVVVGVVARVEHNVNDFTLIACAR